MPHLRLPGSIAGSLLAFVIAAAAIAPSGAAAATTSACTPLPTTKAFARVDGDQSDYSLAPDGGFENGGKGWSFTGGARVVGINENLGVLRGRRALMMPLASTATSPAFCIDETNPHFRFAYKIDNMTLAGFIAYVVYRNASGKVVNSQFVSSKNVSITPTFWQASRKSPLATLVPLSATTKSATVQVKIVALSPTDLARDMVDSILGRNIASATIARVAGSVLGLLGRITGVVSPYTNIGVTVDSLMVDPYRRG